MARRMLTNILSDDLEASRDFYTKLLDMSVAFESDWFINLKTEKFELGFLIPTSELVPPGYQKPPQGVCVTFVVDDLSEVYDRALEMDVEILQEPKKEFYGQTRMLIKDPNNLIVDISCPN